MPETWEDDPDPDDLDDNHRSPAEIEVDQALTIVLPISAIVGDEVLLRNLIEDLAQGIFRPEIIAERYSVDPREIVNLIRTNAEIRKRVQVRRAIWQSNDSIDTRIRQYAGTTLLESLPTTGKKLIDQDTPAGLQLDYLKAYSRIAGVDGLPAAAKGNDGFGQGGQQFVVNFHFSGGRVERISTTTDPNASPQSPLRSEDGSTTSIIDHDD